MNFSSKKSSKSSKLPRNNKLWLLRCQPYMSACYYRDSFFSRAGSRSRVCLRVCWLGMRWRGACVVHPPSQFCLGLWLGGPVMFGVGDACSSACGAAASPRFPAAVAAASSSPSTSAASAPVGLCSVIRPISALSRVSPRPSSPHKSPPSSPNSFPIQTKPSGPNHRFCRHHFRWLPPLPLLRRRKASR
jgi:hypothetical protein